MKLLILFAFLLMTTIIQAQIIRVPEDYSTIQAGIDAANNGDTVLVDPGFYTDNLNFNGKNICVASQYLLNQDPAYITQTIINPLNDDASSVIFDNSEDTTARLIGFKIYGASVYQGSGIYCRNSSPTFRNLIITGGAPGFWGGYGGGMYLENSLARLKDLLIFGNSSSGGGGIYMEDSAPFLENVTIKYNDALYGGGLTIINSTPVFDIINRCNIFFNDSPLGKDLYSSGLIEVIVDTFSVCFPGPTHVAPADNFSFDILNCKIEQVGADLWVSPNGSNDNNGLTEDAPLKTISYAFSKIMADSLNRRTVHLLEGIYSHAASGEFFPVALPQFIDLVGVSKDSVILDAGHSGPVIELNNNPSALISDMTLTGGHASGGGGGGGITCVHSNPLIRNLIIKNNSATYWASGEYGGGVCISYSDPIFENIEITDNHSVRGGGIALLNGSRASFKNLIVAGNEALEGSGIYCLESYVNIENATIANNTDDVGIVVGRYEFNINNSILWNNDEGQISDPYNSVEINYSDVMGGFAGIGNINTDPMFTVSGEYPYSLTEYSDCIDVGMPDTTGLGLPRWDIMGNYRIWDGDGNGDSRIDMGAYEFGALPVGLDESVVTNHQSGVTCFPNPASGIVDFRFSMADLQCVKLKIFDVAGREITTIVNARLTAGEHTIQCNVSDLNPGVYFYRLTTTGNEQPAIGKLLISR